MSEMTFFMYVYLKFFPVSWTFAVIYLNILTCVIFYFFFSDYHSYTKTVCLPLLIFV